MQIRRQVVTEQCEETGDREGFITVSNDLIVDGVQIEVVAQETDGGVYGHHQQNPDYVPLLARFQVVCRMHHDQKEG